MLIDDGGSDGADEYLLEVEKDANRPIVRNPDGRIKRFYRENLLDAYFTSMMIIPEREASQYHIILFGNQKSN